MRSTPNLNENLLNASGLTDVLCVGFHEPIRLYTTEAKLGGENVLVALSGVLEPMRPKRGGESESL